MPGRTAEGADGRVLAAHRRGRGRGRRSESEEREDHWQQASHVFGYLAILNVVVAARDRPLAFAATAVSR